MASSDDVRALRDELARLSAEMDALRARIDAVERGEAPSDIPPPVPTPETKTPEGFLPDGPPQWPPEPPPPEPTSAVPKSPSPVSMFVTLWNWVDPPRLAERVLARMRKASGADPDAGWEILLGAYWFSRLGIALIALAMVFFLAKAIQDFGHMWSPPLRVATGYAACAVLLGLAYRLEGRYPLYGRILFGGAFALTYLVSFATHYLPFSRIFETPAPRLIILGVVTLCWAALAQWRRSRLMAFWVSLLGYATVLLAILTLSEPGASLPAALIGLATGSAFFLLWNRWYYIGALGIVGSYANYGAWLFRQPGSDRLLDYGLALGILAVFFLLFAGAEMRYPRRVSAKPVPLWFRSLFVTANSAAAFTMGMALTRSFSVTAPHIDLFQFGFALVLGAFAMVYLHLRANDPLHHVYLIKAVTVFTMGLATRFSNDSLTAWLAVETVALLVSSRRSGFVTTRILAFAVAILTVGHGLFTAVWMGPIVYDSVGYGPLAGRAALFVMALLAASALYEKTDWTRRSPMAWPVGNIALARLWQLDLVAATTFPLVAAEWARRRLTGATSDVRDAIPALGFGRAPEESAEQSSPLSPYGLTLVALTALLAYSYRMMPTPAWGLPACGAAIALTALAWIRRAPNFGLGALAALIAGAAIQSIQSLLGAEPGTPLALYTATAGGLAFVTALSTERWAWLQSPGLVFHRLPYIPHIGYGIAAGLLGRSMVLAVATHQGAAALGGAALVAFGLALALHAGALATAGTGLTLWACFYWVWAQYGEILYGSGAGSPQAHWLRATAWAIVVLAAAADRFMASAIPKNPLRDGCRMLTVGGAWFMLWVHMSVMLSPPWQPAGAALIGFVALGYGLLTRFKPPLVLALWGSLMVSLSMIGQIGTPFQPVLPFVFGGLALTAFWLLCERLHAQATAPRHPLWNRAPYGTVILATALLVTLIYRVPFLKDNGLILAWGLVGAALCALSLAVGQRLYRYAGLTVIGLALLRIPSALWALHGFYRIGALAGLGTVLLVLAFGYVKASSLIREKKGSDSTPGS